MVENDSNISKINKDNIIGSAIISPSSHIIIADEIIYLFFGITQSIDVLDYIHPDHREKFKKHIDECSSTPAFFMTKCKRYDNVYVDVSIVMQTKIVDNNSYIGIDIFDILFMTSEYQKFIANSKIFNTLISLSDKIFFRYDISNKKFYVYSGKRTYFIGSLDSYRDEMIQNGCIEEASMQQFQQMCDKIEKANGESFFKLNTTFFNNDDDKTFHETIVNFSPIEYNSQIAYIVGFYTNNSSNNVIDDYTSSRSNLDPLTNLLNKKAIKDYALETLAKAAKENQIVTFIMIDLDNFKTINDTYGHMFGDETLVSVSRVMNEAVGNRGVVGRIGGDEFFIVLTGFEDGDESIRPLIRSIRSHVEWCFKNKLDDIKVTCSVGTATYPYDAQNYDDLFKLADHCLYVAKSKGRDRFIIYTKDIHGSLEEILSNGTVIQMANYVSEVDKSNHLLTVIQRFNSADNYDRQQVVLKKVMLELLYFYDIDAVQYCPFDSDKNYYEVSNYTIEEPRILIDLYDTYRSDIEKKNYINIGNYENAKIDRPELYQYMIRSEIYSMMFILDRDMNEKKHGIFVVSTKKRYQKWASYDINMLLILFRLMERFVRN